MNILGAGLAGCLAGALNQNAKIIEAGPNASTHKALLRFRSPDIGNAVGIPFKKVKVYKGIWHNDRPVELSPRYIALYSRKVSDTISYRSICNQETVDRWVAPIGFHDMLRDQMHNRIEYGLKVDAHDLKNMKRPVISTLPIGILASLLEKEVDFGIGKRAKPIRISRYEIPDCNAFMTYYFTDPTTRVYRASIDGSTLIIESMWSIDKDDLKVVTRAFGLTGVVIKAIVEDYEQHNGKIAPINEKARRDFIVNSTIDYGIYSLGRFATWRNLVLDDVYKDTLTIKGLLNKDKYEHNLHL